jgi:hypothetical protein
VIGTRHASGTPSVAFLCDRCGGEVVQAIGAGERAANCPGCGATFGAISEGALTGSRQLSRCLRCGADRLYVQKDFSKKAGLWVFIVAAVLSVPTWGLSLLAATLIDLVLYYALGDATLCYGCGALHRGFRRNPAHGAFDIHTQEAVDRRMRTA